MPKYLIQNIPHFIEFVDSYPQATMPSFRPPPPILEAPPYSYCIYNQ